MSKTPVNYSVLQMNMQYHPFRSVVSLALYSTQVSPGNVSLISIRQVLSHWHGTKSIQVSSVQFTGFCIFEKVCGHVCCAWCHCYLAKFNFVITVRPVSIIY